MVVWFDILVAIGFWYFNEGGQIMSIIYYILIGLVVGVLARLVLPGRQNLGIIMTVLLGALGSFLAGQAGEWLGWWTFPSWIGIVVAVIFAMVLIGIYVALRGRR
jgi:uncharacterized membrane protein YeaQ/YmgE (transglycosylase-associated protein family)